MATGRPPPYDPRDRHTTSRARQPIPCRRDTHLTLPTFAEVVREFQRRRPYLPGATAFGGRAAGTHCPRRSPNSRNVERCQQPSVVEDDRHRSLRVRPLAPEYWCGHGAVYDGLTGGRIDVASCAWTWPGRLCPDQRTVLAVDVNSWLRCDTATSAQHLFCHVYGSEKRLTAHPRPAYYFVV